jgi:hypothetical protein
LKAFFILLFASALAFSCNKYQIFPDSNNPGTHTTRKVRFELFTNENFAGNKDNIQFTLHIGTAPRPVFDSSLATMKIEDIPDSAHRIIIEKSIPGNDTSTLEVGFLYTIENVGNSWYLEPFQVSESFKVVKYAFK